METGKRDNIIMANDLGWERSEQLIFIMFTDIFGHNVMLKMLLL